MSITAKLAYSQLRINRSRTAGAMAAVILATALITAVCSFVASGNAMLVGLLGDDYGSYGESYVSMLLIPAILFGAIILAMAVIVISNVFRVSAGERVAQFGVLKCVGATEKQITETVLWESVLISAAGVPLGILLGLALTAAGIGVANHYFSQLNALVHLIMTEINLELCFVLSWPALLLSAALCFLTVLLSAWLPARKAAKISAIDCIRAAGETKLGSRQVRTGALTERVFGIEGVLAAKNLKRDRRNFRSTVIALASGVALMISLAALSGQAGGIMDYMQPDMDETVLAEYISNYSQETNPLTGREETIYSKPIDSELGGSICRELEKFGGVRVFGLGTDLDRYTSDVPETFLSEDMRKYLSDAEPGAGAALAVEVIALDERSYFALCESAGVSEGSAILLNHFSYNDKGTLVDIIPLDSELAELELVKADGSAETIEVQGILYREQMPKELFYPNTNPIRLVLPRAELRGYEWLALPEDEEGFTAYANQVLSKFFPESEDASYMSSGFNTRVYKTDDYIKVMNIAIVLATVFMYSFAALLLLIGATNVISTITTNVQMRSREFAILQSVGMTSEGLRRMLRLESILCSVKALLYGLPAGILLSLLAALPLSAMFPIPYKLPAMAILLCTIFVFVLTLATTFHASRRMERQNIIETIRAEAGR